MPLCNYFAAIEKLDFFMLKYQRELLFFCFK